MMTLPSFRAIGIARGVARGRQRAAARPTKTHTSRPATWRKTTPSGGWYDLAGRRRFRRHFHRRLPVRRRHRPGRRFGRWPRRPTIRRAASPTAWRRAPRTVDADAGGDRLFRPWHDGRDQRADPASRRAHRADHHRRGFATCWRSAGRSGPTSTTCRSTSRRCWCRATCGSRCRSACATTARIETPLDEAAFRTAVRRLRAAGVQAVAVCFLYGFVRTDHEADRAPHPGARSFPKPSPASRTRSRPSFANSSACPPRW